jgi:phosphatidate cytidylyltransferase
LLRWRLILGALFIAALVGLCWLDFRASMPGAYLGPLAIGLSVLGAGELLAMFRQRGYQPLAWVVYGGTLITVVAAGAPAYLSNDMMVGSVGRLGWLAMGLAGGLLLAMIGELLRYESPGRATLELSLASFAILYMGGLMGFLMQLRLLGGGRFGADGRWGMLALISLIATVKMSDTGQYTAGRLLGRHKMAPRVSPGKTWEGVAGGLVFAIVAAVLVFCWAARHIVGPSAGPVLSYTMAGAATRILVFAALLTAAGIIGDVAESLLKRDVGVKDSSTWLPGFGGVLDLLDSLLGAAPVAYLLWTLGVVGPQS